MSDRAAFDYEPIPLTGYPRRDDREMRQRADDFLATIRTRRTIREFAPDPVPLDIVESCIRSAATAPSGANLQPWHFAVIGDARLKRRIREAAEEEERAFYAERASEDWLEALRPLGTDPAKPFLETAPWLIAIFGARASPGPDGVPRKNYYVPESVSIATGLLIAALHTAGLATLTHTPSPMGFLNEICKRPAQEKPYILLVVGHPAADATVPRYAMRKRPLSEIMSIMT